MAKQKKYDFNLSQAAYALSDGMPTINNGLLFAAQLLSGIETEGATVESIRAATKIAKPHIDAAIALMADVD